MTSAVPKQIRDSIRQKIWDKADELNWPRLGDSDRAVWYENWSRDKDIGGALAHFMDARRVRVYIKDSLLKPYSRTRLGNKAEKALNAAGLSGQGAGVVGTYHKPHGRLLADGRVVCWGNSRDWKPVVISVFERAWLTTGGDPFAAVLFETGKTTNEAIRNVVVDAGRKLGLKLVVWID